MNCDVCGTEVTEATGDLVSFPASELSIWVCSGCAAKVCKSLDTKFLKSIEAALTSACAERDQSKDLLAKVTAERDRLRHKINSILGECLS